MTIRNLVLWACMLLMCAFHSANAQQMSTGLALSPQPDWIKPQTLDASKALYEDQTQDGIFYLLFDRQIKVSDGQPVQYRRFAEKVVNQNGLQSVSNLSVSYDPSYETLKWHSLKIIRDGKIVERQADAKVSTLQREKSLENSIYNGRLTLNIVLPDVRVGDIVEFSYSVTGQNPIYAGHFSMMEYFQWTVPVAQFHFFLDWGKAKKPIIKSVNFSQPLVTKELAGRTIYEFNLENPKPIKTNSQMPSWHDPYGRYYFSDVENWGQVIDWAIPLYEKSIQNSPAIQKIVADIKAQGATLSRRTSLALHYVQDNIRYLGVEMGKNSHQPSLAEDTLSRRYGDCKDKAVLLLSLLRAMGIKAAPALVNTEARKGLIDDLPAINAFDHVIVWAKIDGKEYWLDPTRQYQKGDIEILYQADYGYGLVISKEFNNLVKMNVPRNSLVTVVETIDASGELEKPVSYNVATEYTGLEAESQRSNFLDSNISEKSDQYLNYYKTYYEHIQTAEMLSFKDNSITGAFNVDEKYRIEKFWETEDDKKFEATFYGNTVTSLILKPEEVVRTEPYAIKQHEIKQTIHAKLDDTNWNLKPESFEERNAFFIFTRTTIFDKKTRELRLDFYYKTLVDAVPAAEINNYLKARKRALDKAEYGIYESINSGVDKANDAEDKRNLKLGLIGIAVITFYLLSLIAVLNHWYTDRSRFKYLDESRFYPISPVKFIILSVATLGIYQIYWFYRNWSYVKRVDDSHLLPFWRSFFSNLWFYSFYMRLVRGDESKGVAGLPSAKAVAVVFALIYLAITLLAAHQRWGIIFSVLACCMALPLVLHISKIPQASNQAFKQNSRWLFRHYWLVVMGAPILLLLCMNVIGWGPLQETEIAMLFASK